MTKELCIIHANCQGDSLKQLLLSYQNFSNLFYIEKYTNYLHEEIPNHSLQSCKLFLYQELGDSWGEHATSALLEKIAPTTKTICIPNMFFNGYWPLWTNATHMAYGDIFLEYLAQSGLKFAEILHIYMNGNITNKYNLDNLVNISREKEELKDKAHSFNILNIIDTHWREEQLFHTINHPGPRLTLYVANEILKQLGLGKLPLSIEQSYANLEEEFILPMHPQIGKYFDLPFANKKRLYNVYGQRMNFEQYARAYISCRLQEGSEKIDDFVVYLHLLAQKAKNTWAA